MNKPSSSSFMFMFVFNFCWVSIFRGTIKYLNLSRSFFPSQMQRMRKCLKAQSMLIDLLIFFQHHLSLFSLEPRTIVTRDCGLKYPGSHAFSVGTCARQMSDLARLLGQEPVGGEPIYFANQPFRHFPTRSPLDNWSPLEARRGQNEDSCCKKFSFFDLSYNDSDPNQPMSTHTQ